MGLPLALKAHKEGNTKQACQQYQRALDRGDTNELIFQNYGVSFGNWASISKQKIFMIKD